MSDESSRANREWRGVSRSRAAVELLMTGIASSLGLPPLGPGRVRAQDHEVPHSRTMTLRISPLPLTSSTRANASR